MEVVEHFEQKIKAITDTDYGDFRRKCELYINRMKEELNSPSTTALTIVAKMEHYIRYQYNQDMDEAYMFALDSITELKKQV